MTSPSRIIDGAAIVLRGTFNPRIFQPAWFGANDLLRREEVEKALTGKFVVTEDIATWRAEWFNIRVTIDQFLAETADAAEFGSLGDVVASVFRLLEHTPVERLGLNRMLHLQMATEQDYTDLGHFLAPTAPWADLIVEPRLFNLQVGGKKPNAPDVRTHVIVQPSTRVQPRGVLMQTNDEYSLESTLRVVEILERDWKESLRTGENTMSSLLSTFEKSRA